jgi:hypothetical protein
MVKAISEMDEILRLLDAILLSLSQSSNDILESIPNLLMNLLNGLLGKLTDKANELSPAQKAARALEDAQSWALNAAASGASSLVSQSNESINSLGQDLAAKTAAQKEDLERKDADLKAKLLEDQKAVDDAQSKVNVAIKALEDSTKIVKPMRNYTNHNWSLADEVNLVNGVESALPASKSGQNDDEMNDIKKTAVAFSESTKVMIQLTEGSSMMICFQIICSLYVIEVCLGRILHQTSCVIVLCIIV